MQRLLPQTAVRLLMNCGVKLMANKLQITLVKSTIGQKPAKVATVRSLGLKKISSSVIQDDTPAIRGMIAAVSHLVKVEETK